MSDLVSQPSASQQGRPQSPPVEPPLALRVTGTTRPRLWPSVILVGLMWLLILVPGWVDPGSMSHFLGMFYGPIFGILTLAGWWFFASRVGWSDRWQLPLAFLIAVILAGLLAHPSFYMGLLLFGLPVVLTLSVGWLVLTLWLSWPIRRAGLLVLFVVGWGSCDLFRFDGIAGSMQSEISWRWSPTAEERFLAERGEATGFVANQAVELTLQPGDWPGFRGPRRDGRLVGVRLATDWDKNPPRLLWKQRVGPGWSSLTVIGQHLFTQEQRDQSEVVVCYDTETGKERWVHADQERFTELVAGPGPRATPTFHEGKLYTMGARGTLNCLDAATGKKLWSRNLVADTKARIPQWGFSSSPLVHAGLVSVYAGGPDGKGLIAYRIQDGEIAWTAGKAQHSYCSPHLAQIDGVEQILFCSDFGLEAFDPIRGTLLWDHQFSTNGMARVVQPALLGERDILLGTWMNKGTRRLRLTKADPWKLEEIWNTTAINPYYNDLVLHQGHLYGFDGIFLTCVNLDEGEKRWRARGYGNGQVLLLADQDLLLVLSEQGDIALVPTDPTAHKPIARMKAITGKTWNHPTIAHGKLFVRNGEEMACFALSAP
jgi:outer membrane protein assembly factor BamB